MLSISSYTAALYGWNRFIEALEPVAGEQGLKEAGR